MLHRLEHLGELPRVALEQLGALPSLSVPHDAGLAVPGDVEQTARSQHCIITLAQQPARFDERFYRVVDTYASCRPPSLTTNILREMCI